MLDAETKRRIDSCRDILVGKVPDPKSQVEQITIALIYKFMDDMDAEAEELGGKRSFFAGEYAKYGWAKLMAPNMGGFDVLALYSEAIGKMNENPGIPTLFRDIFKNAYLPYRDPETLRSFLKEINVFTYDHSEKLGDAFEYLLSVLGSQGDAGQFRTPRHIIDFMVEIVDPQKGERILDPACGTAGFLISAWKHILKHNTKKNSGDLLTPEQRAYIAANVHGYDISPDMVRLSLVNLYLHGFTDPHVVEYDTLTSEEKWNEYADVILANPPFMSPKGGIKPHKRFSVQATRSEVLFVDYIAEHLSPNGRAAIIVPEGVIFKGDTAYKQLRQMLVKNSLVAVISLPAGVFNPYAGVKTSILLLDKWLAKRSSEVLFVKVENDGFNLGAQRRAIAGSGLPDAAAAYLAFRHSQEDVNPIAFDSAQFSNALVVEKTRIGENGEWSLSGDRYQEQDKTIQKFEIVELGAICKPEYGFTASAEETGNARFIRITDINPDGQLRKNGQKYITLTDESESYLLEKGDLLVARTGATFGKTMLFAEDYPAVFASYLIRLRFTQNTLLPEFYWAFSQTEQYWEQARNLVTGGGQPQFNGNVITQIKIPLPPLAIQQEIVTEVEGYQKIIDGARQVVENYQPRIDVKPNWPLVKLGEVCSFKRGPFGGSLKKEIFVNDGYAVYEQSHAIENQFDKVRYFIAPQKFNEMQGFEIKPGDLIMSCSGTMGKVAIVPNNVKAGIINQALLRLTPSARIEVDFLKLWMESKNFQEGLDSLAYGAAIRNVASVDTLKNISIPLPDLEIQSAVVAEIEAEQALVNASKQLIAHFEAKIKTTINRVWNK